jgi:hypothetical protein
MSNKNNLANGMDNIPSNSQANLAKNSHAHIEVENEDWTGLSMKEAAKLVKKSYPMMKVLVANNRIKYKKIKGKYGEEIRINENSLLSYYNSDENPVNRTDNNLANGMDNIPSNSQANLANDEDIKIFDRYIFGMEKQIEFLAKEIENKNSEIEKLHKLLENQQSLNLQTVHLLNHRVEEKKPNLLQRIFGMEK